MKKNILKSEIHLQRLDTWLWRSRFFRTRTSSSHFIKSQSIRLNSYPVKKPAYLVKENDILTFFTNKKIVVIKIKKLPTERSPAKAAYTLYDEILEK
ncbi:Heat shock protein 15 [Commensalibacter sp. Nvir]|uniref:S4 domain-containing protein n=1 Tax=Commensalibacter sp. Nvir TaxID=3069817 RepID=UPI002D5080CB|nr:Heat shock protein 15 [Commensalibacter sp. Nvir]